MREKLTKRLKVGALLTALFTLPIVGLVAAAPAGALVPSPTVTGVSPDYGPTAGGTSVTVTGTNFVGVSTVSFGGKAASGVDVVSSTTITVTAPAIATDFVGNTVAVTVTTAAGTSPTSVADDYTYTYNHTSAPTNPIGLSASSTTASANSSVTLTATAVSDVGPTDYGLSILDVSNPASPIVLTHAYSGTSVQVSQASAQTHTYVAEYDACSAYPAACPSGPVGSATISLPSDGAVSTPVTVTWAQAPAPAPALYPLELLGGTGTCANNAVLTLTGGSTVNVDSGSGTLGIVSPCSNSVQVNGGSNLKASSVVTTDPSLNSVDIVANSGSTGPSAETHQSAITDPLTSMTAPSNPTTTLTGSCTGLVQNHYTCSPGYYASLPGFQGGASVSFGSGTYVFKSAISIGNANNVTFGSGTYWFEGGLTIGGGIKATFGTGTYIFGTSSTGTGNALDVANGTTVNGSAGVLFYGEGGSVNLAGGAATTLTGLSQYDDVAIWDAGASGTNNPLQLSGGSSTVIYGGVYVPHGQITLSGSNPTTMEFLVTGTISESNGTTLNVG